MSEVSFEDNASGTSSAVGTFVSSNSSAGLSASGALWDFSLQTSKEIGSSISQIVHGFRADCADRWPLTRL